MLSNLIADIRYGIRILLRSPGFSLIAILALALGIGANTAVFSAIDAVLLRPLPYKDPSRLAMIWEDVTAAGFARNTPAPANYVDWKKQNQVFTEMACFRKRSANIAEGGPPEYAVGRRVSPEFFRVLGVSPLLGRTLDDRDETSRENVIVISYGLWQRRLNGDRSAISRQIRVDEEPYTIVGVMPRGFSFPSRKDDFWTPAQFTAETWSMRDSHFLTVVGRLKPGITQERAQSDMTAIAKRLQEDYPKSNKTVGVVVVPLIDQVVEKSRTGLFVLLAGSAFVLLIACANVANLLLAKAASRQRELAVRAALGAGRARLISQLIVESVMLAAAGGLSGVLLAQVGLKLLERLVPAGMDRELTINVDVFMFSLLASLGTGVLFGVLPALYASRMDINETLKQGGRSNVGGRQKIWRDALVVSEVAMALVLLAGAGLMLKTLAQLRGIEVGFRVDGLLTMQTNLPSPRYDDGQRRLRYYQAVLQEVDTLPGVRSAAFISALPFTTMGNTNAFRIEGRPEPAADFVQDALYRVATVEYLKTLGVRLLEGRLFDQRDGPKTTPVIVINQTFARGFFEGESPIGKRISLSGPTKYTIVGVVADVRERGAEPTAKPGVYLPAEQNPNAWAVPQTLAVRADGDPLALTNAVRTAIWHVDRELPISDVQLMEDVVEADFAGRRDQMCLLLVFAGLALTLAGVGIYGVLSYLVAQQTREIGVRMALGARAGDIVRGVAAKGAVLTGIGLIIGTLAALMTTRAMHSMLFGVAPADPATYAGVIGVLALISAAACIIPAARAARVDPLVALRDE